MRTASYGVEEYYQYDPDNVRLRGWRRVNGRLEPIPEMHGWVSPRLGVRFVRTDDQLLLFRPDGQLFISDMERDRQAEEQERRAERLAEQLRALGIEPEP